MIAVYIHPYIYIYICVCTPKSFKQPWNCRDMMIGYWNLDLGVFSGWTFPNITRAITSGHGRSLRLAYAQKVPEQNRYYQPRINRLYNVISPESDDLLLQWLTQLQQAAAVVLFNQTTGCVVFKDGARAHSRWRVPNPRIRQPKSKGRRRYIPRKRWGLQANKLPARSC